MRARLAARIGDYGNGVGELASNNWLCEFQTAFASALPAVQLITFDNSAPAYGEYQRSIIFIETPWKACVDGNLSAISASAKQGAVLFFRIPAQNRLGCAVCHGGHFITDKRTAIVGFPQTGPGKGDGNAVDSNGNPL